MRGSDADRSAPEGLQPSDGTASRERAVAFLASTRGAHAAPDWRNATDAIASPRPASIAGQASCVGHRETRFARKLCTPSGYALPRREERNHHREANNATLAAGIERQRNSQARPGGERLPGTRCGPPRPDRNAATFRCWVVGRRSCEGVGRRAHTKFLVAGGEGRAGPGVIWDTHRYLGRRWNVDQVVAALSWQRLGL
jgi:hypothetical protein